MHVNLAVGSIGVKKRLFDIGDCVRFHPPCGWPEAASSLVRLMSEPVQLSCLCLPSRRQSRSSLVVSCPVPALGSPMTLDKSLLCPGCVLASFLVKQADGYSIFQKGLF